MITKTKTFLLLITALALTLFSCAEEIYDGTIAKRNYDKISFEQFKKETGLENFDTVLKTNLLQIRNADRTYEVSDFNISTDLIKKLVVKKKTTYTFRVFPIVAIPTNEIFNLTVFYKNGWQMIILKVAAPNLY
ncbi:hypothetical protein [Flavobacterium xanthum]|uniref:Lipoprotein n=1 Tax=Flavobacterium xanthum TaxID=69322 RepID=A0A1M7GL99_9FLAO|nr:hypothetical protein [Flavobacterium xanthum]SHM16981.1 hypothetical protein SAMN05443669_102428 [Flavobacterium xanthum]